MAYDYERIAVRREHGVAWATLDAPPCNVMTLALFGELSRFGQEVGDDPAVRAVVLRSADPEFFIAHFDVEAILGFPVDGEALRSPGNPFHRMCERFRTMPKATIAQIEGRVGGGGAELAAAFDMRFGALGRAVVSQMEVPLGILPGGGGTQRLPRLVGRGCALEMILGGVDVDAATAERWGWLNRALPPEALGPAVDALAHRIAGLPPEAVRLAKAAVDAADGPLAEGLIEEAYLFQKLLRTPGAQRSMRRFLDIGGQTREGERRVGELARAAATAAANERE